MKRFLILLSFILFSHNALSADKLTIAVSEIQPCVIKTGSTYSGFSIDLWKEVATDLGVEFNFVEYALNEKVKAIQSGAADVGIGCISITADREKQVDFSIPVFNSGLQVISRIDDNPLPTLSSGSKKMLAILLLFTLGFSHIMWFSERGSSAINDKYFPGILESIYFTIVTMSTVGYGDITPNKWLGRVGSLLIILTGISLFGVILGQFTADAMQGAATHPVQSIQDLKKYNVGTKGKTTAEAYLIKRGINPVAAKTIEAAYADLDNKKIDVVVYDSPAATLHTQQNDNVIITGPVFNPHYYGFALKNDSSLKEKIDQSILRLQGNGTYKTIYDRWF